VTGALPDVPTLLGVVAMVVGGLVTALAFALVRVPEDLERRVRALEHRSGWVGRLATRLATVPQVAGNAARLALSIVLPALPGLASYLELRRRMRSWDAEAAEPAVGAPSIG
jgi:hypothetical protein